MLSKPLGFLRSKGSTFRSVFHEVKTQREESVNIYDSVDDVLAWNVIYEGPLHASFINVYVITRRRTPRNDIFPRFYIGIQLHRRVVSMQRNRYLPWTNVSSLRVIDVTWREKKRKRNVGSDYKIFPLKFQAILIILRLSLVYVIFVPIIVNYLTWIMNP